MSVDTHDTALEITAPSGAGDHTAPTQAVPAEAAPVETVPVETSPVEAEAGPAQTAAPAALDTGTEVTFASLELPSRWSRC